jgi:aldose 1-epimerase
MAASELEAPSGQQFEIRHGNQRAVVVEVGGGLREYTVDEHPVLDGYPPDRTVDGGRGQPLLPWPNRIADGRYDFGGQALQLPIDEHSTHNAMHGLTRWLNWTVQDHSAEQLTVGLLVHPRPGYPFTLQLAVEYTLSQSGLSVRTTATNRGSQPLPFGAGQHPYYTLGAPRIDSALLQVPARGRLELDPQRLIPTGRVLGVEGTLFDFRAPRLIGDNVLDDCFCDLTRDADGRAHVFLSEPGTGRALRVWVDEHYRYIQVFSGDTLEPSRRRQGLAIEPMTCPPNAFQTQVDLVVLEPGKGLELAWGVAI